MFRFFFAFSHFLLYVVALSSVCLAQEDIISDGSVLHIEDKEFKVTPPIGWEVHNSDGRSGLLLQKPFVEGMKYQPNIRVMTFQEPKYIDDYTADQFEETLIERFSKSSSSIQNYIVRNNQMVNMADGREAILYYTQFTFDKTELMQAHLLISGVERHYLISYTDLTENFEENTQSEGSPLQKAWSSITSVTLESDGPTRFQSPRSLLITTILIIFILCFTWFIRRRKAINKYQKIDDDDDDDDDDEFNTEDDDVETNIDYSNNSNESITKDMGEPNNNWSFSTSSEATQIKPISRHKQNLWDEANQKNSDKNHDIDDDDNEEENEWNLPQK
ncbi:MAG: hypothetical protein AB8C84_06175 [Oligoflexales bacterium]